MTKQVSLSQSLFRMQEPEKILKQNLYDFRKRTDEEDFHFTIGVAMLQLGFLQEAYMAFQKAYECGNNPRDKLFACITLMNAERYEECRNLTKQCSWTEFDAAQISVFIDILERLKEDTENIETFFRTRYSEPTALKDKIVCAIYFAKKDKEIAKNFIQKMKMEEFPSEEDYFLFLGDCHSAGMDSEFIKNILKEIPISKMYLFPLLKAMAGTGTFQAMTAVEIDVWMEKAMIAIGEKESGFWSRILGVVYEVYERRNDKEAMNRIFNQLDKLYETGARDECGLLTIAIHLLKQFDIKNAEKIRDILGWLIDQDQENMMYRKYLYELMMQCGQIHEAETLNVASIEIRKRKDKGVLSLLEAFHRFYGYNHCPLTLTEENEKCPLCLGSEDRPFFKAVCASISPREVYTTKYVSHTISLNDEETMKKIFDWQPMHVASPIVGEYLKSLGAYQSKREFPDVLVPGETYVFIQFKKESLERLVREGYSINQIEPLFSVMFPARKPTALTAAATVDKQTDYKGIVSANDFTIEIVRAIDI